MLAHVHIMKTAGQTFRAILRQSFPGRHCDLLAGRRPATASDVRWARHFYPGLKSIAGHCVTPHSNLREAGLNPRYFTFLRDPFQRCVSHYQFSMQRAASRIPFEKWLGKYRNFQTRILSRSQEADRAIEVLDRRIGFVGLVERFNESLVLFQDWCNDPELDIRYQSVNIATDNHIKNEILADPKAVALIDEYHEQDRILYRYARDVIYNRQVKQFGPTLPAALQDLEDSLPGPTILSFSHFVAAAKRDILYKPMTRYIRRAA
jgi:hypothetical protein